MQRRPVLILSTCLVLLVGCSSTTPNPADSDDPEEQEPPALTLELVTDELPTPREVIDLGEGVLLVSDQHGTIYVIEDGARRPEPLLSIADEIRQPTGQALELGLAGFQIAPDFETSGTFYTFATYTPGDDDPEDATRMDVVTAWTADPTTLQTDPASAVVVIEIPQHGSDHVGDLLVDPDGTMWVGVGSPGPTAPAQDPDELPGSLLRIVPAPNGGYTVPGDNPFVDGGGADEIFSLGYRNPWRSTYDPDLGLLIAEAMSNESDQHLWQPQPGDNAGYPVRNGVSKTCWAPDRVPVAECLEVDGVPMALPVLEYGPEFGTIISAAVGVHGEQYGALAGRVLVGNWNGKLLFATPGEPPWPFTEIELTAPIEYDRYLWDAAAGLDGTIYLSTTAHDLAEGELWRLVPTG